MELVKFKGLMMAYKLTNTNRKMTIISKTHKNSHIRTKTMSCIRTKTMSLYNTTIIVLVQHCNICDTARAAVVWHAYRCQCNLN